mmetsp:Transcript_60967/g.69071  ORF Transcript_60967/g.69071 Transcript_60967/m.69071 type:complete len:87 (-) Transcript_60967:60-320(-)
MKAQNLKRYNLLLKQLLEKLQSIFVVRSGFFFHPPSIDDITQTTTTTRVEFYDTGSHMVTTMTTKKLSSPHSWNETFPFGSLFNPS